MSAESRTADLLRRTPGLRDEIIKRIDAGAPVSPDVNAAELKAFVEGRPIRRPGLESSHDETVRVRGYEAIVRRFGRPVLLIQNDTFADPEIPSVADLLRPHRARIENAIKRVGRVEFINHSMPWGGTGWMVARDLVITNRHVAELVAESIGLGQYRFRISAAGVPFGARLDFREELGPPPDGAHEVVLKSVKFLARSDQPDIALLQISADGPLPEPLELLDVPAGMEQQIAIIGYPAYDSRNDPEDIERYFGDIFDVKRLAPGLISQIAGEQHFFMHDATTLGGNSGSVVLDLASGKALGLHFAGTYLEGNFAVTAAQIRRALTGLSAMITVPPELASIAERPDGKHAESFFKNRGGYDESFLGEEFRVPLLGLGAHENDAAEPVSDISVSGKFLRYTHFSVAYSASRRMPIFTAVNINGDAARKIKRKDDQWFSDLRLPADLQLTREDYEHPDIDRGHMVRREDPNWGTQAVATAANADTFHYTNSAPQHARMNQGKTQWLGLEDYVLSNARTHGLAISVFTGPILRETDPVLENGIQVPEEFWKVVVAVDENSGRLRSTGYILSQGHLIGDITESFVFGQYRTYQVAVETIAAATGLDFGELVRVDALKRQPVPEAVPGRPLVIPLEDLESMVL